MSISHIVAINRYFGKKPGQTLSEFAGELRQLTDSDKEELVKLLSIELKEEVLLKK